DFLFIVFDAHPDLMDDFSPPSQEGYLRNLIEEDIIKPENVILIGIRNWDTQEIDYINSKKIKYFTSKMIFEKGIKEVVNEILKIIEKKENKIYLSLDIDVVDPIEAIGTGYIEHGGMSSREIIYFIQKIKETKKIQMIDLVEINPQKDINDITSKLGAKLVTELGDY
ncbi:MAG: arginase family protein, partial [Candidatus Nanoarchaeia archaeon]|nr:arginase family protein [Candidatus Nanoarchaeia archaeon]